ncbi:two-component system, NtrC family, response regulator HydG [Chitinophaga ginsengisegetis]|uniref:Two-component system, NtrC family, response regulator HydG n=1 Tax=Chitinophaga ginsengisegetis TaxID=393003 RepID=A0A1T5P5N9_9BACT|nr:sigma-54 dependent transcriptional regulator [Chitinophaga ginsengisegetis]MDR6566446.1 two-component system response regulator HydG [Chitinophaga ginsengisegetis]MDR6646176.1 two-component system response regulator HydG [Chitinophaga ginsengisegetis]MDR6651232.1 two-component system response regulator HydG [Chitinophaga ginsengisegetis]SKD08022.1 two-component system, NtrC family, response regulator HydG [Chitinophaga ginsengisegetis]
MKNILIIDDEINICTLLSKFLGKHGFDVDTTMTGGAALKMMKEKTYDLVLCDYRLKDTDGAQLLQDIHQINPSTIVIIITGYTDVRVAVEMVKNGAYDYLSKPLYPDEILNLVHKAFAHKDAEQERRASRPVESGSEPEAVRETLLSRNQDDKNNKYVYGESEGAKELIRQIKLVAPTDYSVIIFGETGTGKESVAHLIHHHSKRNQQPFVALDCGSLSKELAASELFGHEKGSFTGAINTKIGAFEQAQGGTLFLDEISNLSYDIQVALLRVLQEKLIRRVGSLKEIPIDVRIIVASNEKLSESVQRGKFREDLFHRLNEFTIYIPPLRERREDLPLFTTAFVNQVEKELDKSCGKISSEVWDCFQQYNWPGNIRELKNVIRRACLLTPEMEDITMIALPLEMKESFNQIPEEVHVSGELALLSNDNDLKTVALQAEYNKIINVLKEVKYNKTKAAQVLNIDRKTLYNKLRLLNINY